MKLRSNTPISEFTNEQIRHITSMCLDFCYLVFGYNNRKRNQLNVYIHNDSPNHMSHYAPGIKVGEYCPILNEIRLFRDNIPTLGEFTSTFIHEYTHSVQPIRTKYYKLIEDFSYDNHPFEVEARKNEKLYNRRLLNHIKKCFIQS